MKIKYFLFCLVLFGLSGLPASSSAKSTKLDARTLKKDGSLNTSTKIKFSGRQGVTFGGVNPSVPIITSFAMKEDGASPGVSGEDGNTYHQVVSPRDINELFSHLKSEEFTTIRYSAYRTALKLNTLLKGL